jgi:hypothetical protein
MDNTSKSFAQKIISELENIKQAVLTRKEQEKANTLTGQSTEQTHVPRPSTLSTTKSNLPPTAATSDYSGHKEKERREAWTFRVQMVGAVILFAYTTFAALQWHEMKETVEAMNKQMRISVRPWIGIADEALAFVNTPIEFDQEGVASTTYKITAKNFGNAAGHTIAGIVELLLTKDFQNPAILNRQNYQCVEIGKFKTGPLLFPGARRVGWEGQSKFFWREAKEPSSVREFEAWMVGCFEYRDQFDFSYHTRFIYRFEDPVTRNAIMVTPNPNSSVAGQFRPYKESTD